MHVNVDVKVAEIKSLFYATLHCILCVAKAGVIHMAEFPPMYFSLMCFPFKSMKMHQGDMSHIFRVQCTL